MLIITAKSIFVAWCSGLERYFCDGHDCKVDGSTLTRASFLRSWMRCFTIIIRAWCNLASSKLKDVRRKAQPENSETKEIPLQA